MDKQQKITDIKEENSSKIEIHAEYGKEETPDLTGVDIRELAANYARYLKENGIKPGDATFIEDDELKQYDDKSESEKKNTLIKILAAPIDLHDRIQLSLDKGVKNWITSVIKEIHRITRTYYDNRRVIATDFLVICLISAAVLITFNKNTLYEYAYNGKVLGYVENQEEVTNVLGLAGEVLSDASDENEDIEFKANQNITFKLVDGTGSSSDDIDTTTNKLAYLTDIETEAYGIYDDGKLITIVKSEKTANELLEEAKNKLSETEPGMKLISSDFKNKIDIKPINILLSSIQNRNEALRQMTEGDSAEYYHIVEADETKESLRETFGVDAEDIYDENNDKQVGKVYQGDKVCIRKKSKPLSVKMVETGKMREIVKYETVKKDSKDYYIGDTHVEQEGVDGIQIFEGTVTKVSGKIVDRQTKNIEVIREKQDKVVLVGTTKRPKTAPNGTYIIPTENFIVTSGFGARWGTRHEGADLAAPTGTPIYATDGGTIVQAGYYGGYGLCIDIQHEPGRLTRYGHCSATLVNVGDKVYQGQLIGKVGNTGRSTGPHLHFEIRFNGTAVNPLPYLGLGE